MNLCRIRFFGASPLPGCPAATLFVHYCMRVSRYVHAPRVWRRAGELQPIRRRGDHPAEVAEWASSVTDMREACVGLTEPFRTKQPMAGAHSNDSELFLVLNSGPNSACYSPRFDMRSK